MQIFAKVGCLDFEEDILQLVVHECVPVLLYCLKICVLSRTLQALDFTMNRVLMKLSQTSNIKKL